MVEHKMKVLSFKSVSVFAFSALLLAGAHYASADDHDHDHSHAHNNHDHNSDIYAGYFEDDQIKDRPLADWEGDWQSVYPYLQDGTLNEVFKDKAEHGDKTAEEYKAYYDTGYQTDVERIVIDGSNVTFFANGEEMSGDYQYDGYEILNYEAGNRGVRFIFELEGEGADDLPQYIQFSDHSIYPTDADHYHLYWGNNREALLDEVTNWPTYYPSELSGEEVVDEMLAH